MKKLLAALLLLPALCFADTAVRFGGVSLHTSDEEFNSFHRLFVVEHDSYFAGYFRNSYSDDTFILGKSFLIEDTDVLDISWQAGLTYGYREDSDCYKYQGMDNYSNRIVCPYVGLDFKLDHSEHKPAVTAAPGFVVFTLGYDF